MTLHEMMTSMLFRSCFPIEVLQNVPVLNDSSLTKRPVLPELQITRVSKMADV